jgi:hypothetical protein
MRDFSVIAIIAAYNEEDIVGQVVGDLIAQGVSVYFIDDGSTDGTIAAVEPYLGRGLLAIEPWNSAREGKPLYDWTGLLRRKEALSRDLDADWFIHHDADEFRESPWPGRNLRTAIEAVDRLGYNAIDFALFDFWPTEGDPASGADVRNAFRYYDRAQPYNRVQVRCWKKTAGEVVLTSSGGHDALFAGRRVFPIRFLLRHYPIRGEAHGLQKVLTDRLPRFDGEEREKGWHIQYDELVSCRRFVRSRAELTLFDAEQVRLQLLLQHRFMEEASEELRLLREELRARVEELEQARVRLQHAVADADTLRSHAEGLTTDLRSSREQVDALRDDVKGLETALGATTARVQALEASWSWRLTDPGRRAVGWLRKGR